MENFAKICQQISLITFLDKGIIGIFLVAMVRSFSITVLFYSFLQMAMSPTCLSSNLLKKLTKTYLSVLIVHVGVMDFTAHTAISLFPSLFTRKKQ